VATPFAIAFAVGAICQLHLALDDYRRVLARPHRHVQEAQPQRPVQEAQPQRPVQEAQPQRPVQEAQPQRPVQEAQPQQVPNFIPETPENSARCLMQTMVAPQKRFAEKECPICMDDFGDESSQGEQAAASGGGSASPALQHPASDSGSPLNITFLPCGHGFHTEPCCLDWVKKNLLESICPICRSPLFQASLGRRVFL
jgi:hypothetical protein